VISKLLLAWSLMAICVAIHAMGVTSALRWWGRRSPQGYWPWTSTLVLVAGWMNLLHLIEIILWGSTYAFAAAMPDLPSAIYFSAVTYTTTGYGDLTLPEDWRLVGGVEALTGILMCGISTGFFVAVVTRMLQSIRQDSKPA
jgi:prepilin signal peptidase PulO-like enzyme (type II secretory pathway)